MRWWQPKNLSCNPTGSRHMKSTGREEPCVRSSLYDETISVGREIVIQWARQSIDGGGSEGCLASESRE